LVVRRSRFLDHRTMHTATVPTTTVPTTLPIARLSGAVRWVRSRLAPTGEDLVTGRLECRWQRDQLPTAVRELVLDDQRRRNDICWSVFEV